LILFVHYFAYSFYIKGKTNLCHVNFRKGFMSSINFYWKSTCTTCRKARSFLINAGVTMNERDLAKKPFTKNEVIELLAGRNASSFVNPKSTPYKALGLQNKNLTQKR